MNLLILIFAFFIGCSFAGIQIYLKKKRIEELVTTSKRLQTKIDNLISQIKISLNDSDQDTTEYFCLYESESIDIALLSLPKLNEIKYSEPLLLIPKLNTEYFNTDGSIQLFKKGLSRHTV